MILHYERIPHSRFQPLLGNLAYLRSKVLEEFPYLYQLDRDAEQAHLEGYTRDSHCFAVVVRHGTTIVGATTAAPLRCEDADLQELIERAGAHVQETYYFGKSVLLRPYRGHGAGRKFFQERESWARGLGVYRWAAFAVVERPETHPLCPPGHYSLHGFWERRGFRRALTVALPRLRRIQFHPNAGRGELSIWLKELPAAQARTIP